LNVSVRIRREEDVLGDDDKKFVLFFNVIRGGTEYRWRLRHGTGETIARSAKGYENKRECEEEIESAKTECPGASVLDLTVAAG
jgi:uncharacterized protein YegP (UPF0339 family)